MQKRLGDQNKFDRRGIGEAELATGVMADSFDTWCVDSSDMGYTNRENVSLESYVNASSASIKSSSQKSSSEVAV